MFICKEITFYTKNQYLPLSKIAKRNQIHTNVKDIVSGWKRISTHASGLTRTEENCPGSMPGRQQANAGKAQTEWRRKTHNQAKGRGSL